MKKKTHLKQIYFSCYGYIKVKEFLKFGDVEIEKRNFHSFKGVIAIDNQCRY